MFDSCTRNWALYLTFGFAGSEALLIVQFVSSPNVITVQSFNVLVLVQFVLLLLNLGFLDLVAYYTDSYLCNA